MFKRIIGYFFYNILIFPFKIMLKCIKNEKITENFCACLKCWFSIATTCNKCFHVFGKYKVEVFYIFTGLSMDNFFKREGEVETRMCKIIKDLENNKKVCFLRYGFKVCMRKPVKKKFHVGFFKNCFVY